MSLVSTTTVISALVATAALPEPLASLHAADDDHAALPASCIHQIGIDPIPDPPRWHQILPTISVGFELWPDHRARHDHDADDHHTSSRRHQHRGDRRTRFTVNLRWSSGPDHNRHHAPLPETPAVSGYCAQLLELRNQHPDDLHDAVVLYTEASRLFALINADTNDGEDHE